MDELIEPILIAALNENAGQASAEYARMVLLQSLAASKTGYRLGVPRVPLAELIDGPARRYLGSRGCEIRLGAGEKNGVCPYFLDRSGTSTFCAVPPWRLEEMGGSGIGNWKEQGRGREKGDGAEMPSLQWKPIVAAHMFFKGGLPEFDRACVAGEPFGWVFNKSRDFGLRQRLRAGSRERRWSDCPPEEERPDIPGAARRRKGRAGDSGRRPGERRGRPGCPAQRSQLPPAAMPPARALSRPRRTCSWRATGPRPAGPRLSRAPSARVTPPLRR